MLMAFELSMPNIGSWNGKWTGEGKCYAKVLNFTQKYGTSKAAQEKAKSILGKRFSYDFGDGWRAEVKVSKVDSKAAAKLRKNSAGFMGYDWMIDSILRDGKIQC